MPKLINKESLISFKLLLWYKKNKRNLPWRQLLKTRLPDPYLVLISEFMLQQTTVNTVISRFNEFIHIWPNIIKLGSASENQVLQFWSGLGYYSRAKNLHKTAQIISNKFESKIPTKYDELIYLPGVGDYTAKAIMGIAYNKPTMPIDANIERIISRLYGLRNFLPLIKKDIKFFSEKYISKKQSSNLYRRN